MPQNSEIARWIFIAGVVLILLSAVFWLLGKMNITLGQLPGDLKFERGNFSCLVPIASSVIISLILTLLINLIIRSMGK